MPSLHFATSLMAAHLLSEVGPVAGALGWIYAADARPGARVPRRALRRRPDRWSGAGGGRPDRRAAPAIRSTVACRRACRRSNYARGRSCGGGKATGRTRRVLNGSRPPVAASGSGPEPTDANGDEEMPRVVLTRGRVLGTRLFVASALAFLYFVLPKLLGLHETWDRIQHGRRLVARARRSARGVLVLRLRVAVPRRVRPRQRKSSAAPGGGASARIDWPASYQITMAGLAATRLFAAAGAGGIALTAWALRRSGMGARPSPAG